MLLLSTSVLFVMGCHHNDVRPPPKIPPLEIQARFLLETPVPEIPDVVPWGDFGGIIVEYDEALTGCNIDKAGIRKAVDRYKLQLEEEIYR